MTSVTPDLSSDLNKHAAPPLLYIGKGVKVVGAIEFSGPSSERAIVLGESQGNVDWNGVVHVPVGGTITGQSKIKARELWVEGTVQGGEGSDGVVIETGLLRLSSTAIVNVDSVSVPPGGLEQARGSRINARVEMTDKHPYADLTAEPVAAAAVVRTPVAQPAAVPSFLRTSVTGARSPDVPAGASQAPNTDAAPKAA